MNKKTKIEQFNYIDPHSSRVDEPLISAIRGRLQSEPDYYLNILRMLIDEVPGTVPMNDILEDLKPIFTKEPKLNELFPGGGSGNEPATSINTLFDPRIRRTLNELQQSFFDAATNDKEKKRIAGLFDKIRTHCLHEGPGRDKNLSDSEESKIILNFLFITRKCDALFNKLNKDISKRKKENKGNLTQEEERSARDYKFRNLVKDTFPAEFNKIKGKIAGMSRPQLRNEVLLARFNIKYRMLQEIIRNNGLKGITETTETPITLRSNTLNRRKSE